MYLVGFPQMQQSCSLSEIITSAFISILSSLNNSLNDSLNDSLGGLKIDSAMVTTSGKKRTITLQKDFTEMTYFNIGALDGITFFPARNVVFTAPRTVSFEVRGLANGTATENTSAQYHGYLFVGR